MAWWYRAYSSEQEASGQYEFAETEARGRCVGLWQIRSRWRLRSSGRCGGRVPRSRPAGGEHACRSGNDGGNREAMEGLGFLRDHRRSRMSGANPAGTSATAGLLPGIVKLT